MRYFFFLLVSGLLFTACSDNNSGADPTVDTTLYTPHSNIAAPSALNYNIIAQYPHDTGSYTEGLEFYKGKLYESGGDYASSVLQFGDAKTGKIDRKNKMGTDSIFGEGITILNGKLYQLTYTNYDVYVYDVNDISKKIKTLRWPAQGWGMTNNGTDIILNSGNNNLYFVDPETFAVRRTLPVYDNAGAVNMINELEFIDGFIWANVYTTNRIVKIDPQSGHVVADMYLNNLLRPEDSIPERTDVLNGIAYDSTSKTLFITGKRWPKMFEIKIN